MCRFVRELLSSYQAGLEFSQKGDCREAGIDPLVLTGKGPSVTVVLGENGETA